MLKLKESIKRCSHETPKAQKPSAFKELQLERTGGIVFWLFLAPLPARFEILDLLTRLILMRQVLYATAKKRGRIDETIYYLR